MSGPYEDVYWTPEMDDALIGLRKSKIGWNKTSEIIGVDQKTAMRRAVDLGISFNMHGIWTPELDACLRDYRSYKISWENCASLLGLGITTVVRRGIFLGIAGRTKDYAPPKENP